MTEYAAGTLVRARLSLTHSSPGDLRYTVFVREDEEWVLSEEGAQGLLLHDVSFRPTRGPQIGWIEGQVVTEGPEIAEWEALTAYPYHGYFLARDMTPLARAAWVRLGATGMELQGATMALVEQQGRLTVLSDGEGPGGPGFYQASGLDPSFYVLQGLVERGVALPVERVWTADGTELFTVEVGRQDEPDTGPRVPARWVARGLRAENPSHNVTIGRKFLEAALNDYANWREKWWRECVQNAVDAGATEIALSVRQNEDGTYTVACDDNGRGMDLSTLMEKFLVLGETSKTSTSGGVGGFGKAKEMLILPWIAWRVEISGHRVDGAGLGYDVVEGPERKGVRLEVVMPADKYTSVANAREFLGKCDLRGVKVKVNDEAFTQWLVVKSKLREMPDKADIYVKKTPGERQYVVLVRARGLYMFDTYAPDGLEAIVVVEITGPSIELLAANRDGFRHYGVKREFEDFLGEMAKDPGSALRAKTKRVRLVYRGEGLLRADDSAWLAERDRQAREQAQRTSEMLEVGGEVLAGQTSADASQAQRLGAIVQQMQPKPAQSDDEQAVMFVPSGEVVREVIRGFQLKGPEHTANVLRAMVWRPDFILINERDDFRIPRGFKPESMSPTSLRLMRVWTELCRYVLMKVNYFKPFGVGYIFDTGARAAYLHDPETDWLVLNPYKDARGDAVYRPTDPEDLALLFALAIHECTHMAGGATYHDEVFATRMTDYVAVCTPDLPKIKRVVASIPLRRDSARDDAP